MAEPVNLDFEDWEDPLAYPDNWIRSIIGTGSGHIWRTTIAYHGEYGVEFQTGGYAYGRALSQDFDATFWRGKNITVTVWAKGGTAAAGNTMNSLSVQVDGTGGWADWRAIPSQPSADWVQLSIPRLYSGLVPEDATTITVTVKGYSPQFGPVYTYFDFVEIDPAFPDTPTVTTDPASALSAIAATLNGTLANDGGDACDCGFEWGETPAYGNTTPTQSRTTGQTFSQEITGLDHTKTYHFRAFATNAAGTSYGADRTFTTEVDMPSVTTDPATALSAIAGTLNGTLDDDGGEACDCGFEWGLDTGYGTITATESKTTGESFSQVIGGLSPGTTYHFRSFATNSVGTGYGADRTFATALVISKGYALAREEL